MIPPAKTGRLKSNNTAVITILQRNIGICLAAIREGRMFTIVVIKFTAPRMEEIPAKCKLKIARSTEKPLWKVLEARGGYTVHPVPTPLPTKELLSNRVKDGGSNQKERLFIRGKAISGHPNIKGIIQLPNPPIIIGMTMKKIIIKACAVTKTL